MLKLIKNNFVKSEVKIKIQLYILPLFCIYFYIYLFDNKNTFINLNNTNTINTLLSKKFDGSYLNMLKNIESFCIRKKIKIDFLNYNKNNLLIKGKATLNKINILITKIENINNFSKINTLNIEKTSKKNKYLFSITTEFKKFYIKKKKEEVSFVDKKKKNIFKLKAIISNHVLLNNKWYTLNDFLGKYKIILIEKNNVVLNYKNKNITLKLDKNE
jgi:hypothetical protein